MRSSLLQPDAITLVPILVGTLVGGRCLWLCRDSSWQR